MPLHTPEYEQFLVLLTQSRCDRGISQTELSKRLGKTQQYVSRCEVGERRLDLIELHEWCEALGVDSVAMYGQLCSTLRARRHSSVT